MPDIVIEKALPSDNKGICSAFPVRYCQGWVT